MINFQQHIIQNLINHLKEFKDVKTSLGEIFKEEKEFYSKKEIDNLLYNCQMTHQWILNELTSIVDQINKENTASVEINKHLLLSMHDLRKSWWERHISEKLIPKFKILLDIFDSLIRNHFKTITLIISILTFIGFIINFPKIILFFISLF